MGINALTDISWVKTMKGTCTVREALLRAHEPDFSLDLKQPAYEIVATFRFLLSVTALVLRYENGHKYDDAYDMLSLSSSGLSEEAIDKAFDAVASSSDILDPDNPFFQRPVLKPSSVKDTARKLGPGAGEVKKLLPTLPSDPGENYWNLLVGFPKELSLSEAVVKLVAYHYYSMAGNGGYDGDKPRMGAPGIRFLGKGNAATEFMWTSEESGGLLYSLFAALPKNWVEGEGLPAWADRKKEHSQLPNGLMHPLWVGTWSSNTAACFWEERDGSYVLTGVRPGGVPVEWFPIAYAGKESDAALKEWWDIRNEDDPMYLYMADAYKKTDGTKKAQRLDFGRDGTDLAVEWMAEEKLEALLSSGSNCVIGGDGSERKPIFFRHQIEGTASSPSIRASDVFIADPELWGFGLSRNQRRSVQRKASLIRLIHRKVTGIFRRRNAADAKNEANGYPALVLDAMENSRQDASAEFWRQITPVYEEYMAHLRQDTDTSEELESQILGAAMRTFDVVTQPFLGQYPQQIYAVRGSISRIIRSEIRKNS